MRVVKIYPHQLMGEETLTFGLNQISNELGRELSEYEQVFLKEVLMSMWDQICQDSANGDMQIIDGDKELYGLTSLEDGDIKLLFVPSFRKEASN